MSADSSRSTPLPPNRELRIRAYLGDKEARITLGDASAISIDDLLQDRFLLLEPSFENAARELVYSLMQRARRNVELLVERLRHAGYLFLDGDGFVPPSADVSTQLEEFERKIKMHVPLMFRAWIETVGQVSLMGTHPGWPEITYNGLGGSGHAICADPLVVFWTPDSLLSG